MSANEAKDKIINHLLKLFPDTDIGEVREVNKVIE